MSPFWEIRVLLIETNATVVRMVEKVLEETSVRHFLRRIDNVHDLNFELRFNRPDVLITGRSMKELDASLVLDQAKLYTPDIPVIVLASDFNAPLNIGLVNKGAYDIVYHSEIRRLPKEIAFIYQSGRQNIA